jgi:hypothetical protein
MKPDRQQLIESLATGNINEILKKSPYKFFFTVFLDDNPNGTIGYKLEVLKYATKNKPFTRETRTGIGNFEDTLTAEEKKYMELCHRIGRICCFEISS